jgi:hypothetical protein
MNPSMDLSFDQVRGLKLQLLLNDCVQSSILSSKHMTLRTETITVMLVLNNLK